MIRRVFTFGREHSCAECGSSLEKCYVVIRAKDPRAEMLHAYGHCWAFEYENELLAGVSKYGLRRIQLRYVKTPGACGLCCSVIRKE